MTPTDPRIARLVTLICAALRPPAGAARIALALGPRRINRRFDLTFGPLPLTAVLYMGVARKPLGAGAAA